MDGSSSLQDDGDPDAVAMHRREQEPSTPSIEMAFSKLKAHLRAAGARTFDVLWRAIGGICDLYSPQECWNYFTAAGYASD